jgi:hypothetical protein
MNWRKLENEWIQWIEQCKESKQFGWTLGSWRMDELGKIGHKDNPWKLGNNWAQENVTNWGNGTMDRLEENEQSKDIGQQTNS